MTQRKAEEERLQAVAAALWTAKEDRLQAEAEAKRRRWWIG